ncbi:MAG: ribonuclease III [Marinifilaceae bacterium]
MRSKLLQSIKLRFSSGKKFYGLSYSDLGFVPENEEIFRLALIHRSASVYKDGFAINNERLEFLGDAVLGAIVAEMLYKFFPNKGEGFLTQLRSKIVSRESLNKLAIELGLDKEVISKADLSRNKHIYGDVFESFIGATYLDQGYGVTKQFIEQHIFPNYIDIEKLVELDTNYKSRLVEWAQKNKKELFFDTNESIPPVKGCVFLSQILIEGDVLGEGRGHSKKEAEQKAAKEVIHHILD